MSAESLADSWNLGDLYPSVAAWNADTDKLTAQITELARCRGHLGDSATVFKQCLELQTDMEKRLNRMSVYAYENLSADTGNPASLQLRQKVELLDSKVSEAQAFVRPEILRVGSDRVGRFLAEDKALAIYRHPLDEILRAAPHTLDDEGEALIAKSGVAAEVTVRVMAAVCVTPPPVAVTVTVAVPVVAVLLAEKVKVELPLPGAAMELGLKLAVWR